MNTYFKKLKTSSVTGLVSYLILAASNGYAEPLNLSNTPLFLGAAVDPNILLIIDDSGSMDGELNLSEEAQDLFRDDDPTASNIDHTPDNQTEARRICPGYNVLAYNPSKTYEPWLGLDINDRPYADMNDITRVRDDPFETGVSNINDHAYIVWNDVNGDNRFQSNECSTLGLGNNNNNNNNNFNRNSCRTNSTCFLVSELTAAEQTNYANWYSYFRKRDYIAKGATLNIIDSSKVRLGLATLKNNRQVGTIITDMDDENDATTDDSNNKKALMKQVARIEPGGNTPLRATLLRAGEYFKNGDNTLFSNGNSRSPILSALDGGACQSNFSVMMSDGFTNEDGSPGVGDVDRDGLSNTLADVAQKYFNDDLSPLADQVPDKVVGGSATTNQRMETFTVAFGVKGNMNCAEDAVLEDGSICPDKWPTQISFRGNDPAAVDDMRHAADNTNGKFFEADDASSLAQALIDAVSIASTSKSFSAVSANSTSLQSNTVIYLASFNSDDASGELKAVPIKSSGDTRPACQDITVGSEVISFNVGDVCLNTDENANSDGSDWSAAELLNARITTEVDANGDKKVTDRLILTSKPSKSTGILFDWPDTFTNPKDSELDPAQIAALLGNTTANQQAFGERLSDYIRGDQSNEGLKGSQEFRERSTVLGDIINSGPAFVAGPRFNYPNNLESKPYSTFKAENADRTPMIYIGANDGMLHGFNAESKFSVNPVDGSIITDNEQGQEAIAYVPTPVFAHLNEYASPTYEHLYMVDGSPTVGDAFFDQDWHTVLVGGLNAGGQGIYALDVTNPDDFSENTVLWEFTDQDDPNLGYTFSRPDIVRLNNGQWAAIFGNGYNNSEADGAASGTGNAYLFINAIKDGKSIKSIELDEGSVDTPNGLATVTPVDANGDSIVDYIYGGDLLGNLWRIDVSSSDANDWAATKLFTATAPGTNNVQAITSRPSVSFHPEPGRNGFLIYFGTGRFIDVADTDTRNQETQSFYAVWDDLDDTNNIPDEFNREDNSSYVEQTITEQPTFSNDAGQILTLRITSDNPIDWNTHTGWYIDLIFGQNNFGERQISNSIIRGDRIVFTTITPSNIPCDPGSSFLMELSTENGGQPDDSSLDINGDGLVNADDLFGDNSEVVTGLKRDGIITGPTVIEAGSNENASGDTPETKLTNGSNGVESIAERPPGGQVVGERTSWTELQRN